MDRLNSSLQKRGGRRFQNPNSIDISAETDEDDDAHEDDVQSQQQPIKPYRYFIFDIECSQSEEVEAGKFKHVPLLICAELICTECIAAGISVGRSVTDNPARPDTCICRGADTITGRGRQWVVPNSGGRQFAFHSFDDRQINPVDEMLDFLAHHGPLKANTVALSHNGSIFLNCFPLSSS